MIIRNEKWHNDLERLYHDRRLRSVIYRCVSQSGGNIEDADDLLHDTMLVLAQHLDNGHFRGDSSLLTYSAGIARQLWFNKQRSKKAAVSIEAVPDEALQHRPRLNDRDSHRYEVVEHVIYNRLPPALRELLLLYAQQMSFQEMAAQTGAPSPDAVKQKTYRCIHSLQQMVRTHPDMQYI